MFCQGMCLFQNNKYFYNVIKWKNNPCLWKVLTQLCCVFRFLWSQIHSTVRGTTGNWTPVRSQPRWCVVTLKESCSSSLSWPAKWKQRTWAEEHWSTAQISTLLKLPSVKLLRSHVRPSSAVLSPSSPSWRETLPRLGPPDPLLSPVCRSEPSSSSDKSGQRGASAGTLRSISSRLQLEVPSSAQQEAAHTTNSLLRGCMLAQSLHSPHTRELLLISAAHTAVTSLTLYQHLPMIPSVSGCDVFQAFHVILLQHFMFFNKMMKMKINSVTIFSKRAK